MVSCNNCANVDFTGHKMHLLGTRGHRVLSPDKEGGGEKNKVQAFALKVFLNRRDLLLS